VQLLDESDKDNVLFSSEPLGKLEVSGELTGFLLKEAIAALYFERTGKEAPEFRVRCPQNDFGAVVSELDLLEDLNMFDDKEFFMQVS
jgi:hypothetical protein